MAAPTPSNDKQREDEAARGFLIINLVRIGSLVTVLAGIAGAQNALPLPYPLAVALTLAGFFGFFFGPYYLARHYKARNADTETKND